MKNLVIIVGILVLVLLAGCTANQSSTGTTSQASATGNTGPTQNTVADKTASQEVIIQDYSYKPAEITIKKGTAVLWTNKDSVGHTVTSDDGLFDSGILSQGESWSHTFNEAGTFGYYCTIHQYMKGTVIVE